MTITRRAGGTTGEQGPRGRLRALLAAAATLAAGGVALHIGSTEAFGLGPNDVFTGAMLIGVGATAATLPLRWAAITVGALVAVWLLGYAAYDRIPALVDTSVPVQDAVGAAAYFRTPYLNLQLAEAALLVVTFGLGVALARWAPSQDSPAVDGASTQAAAAAVRPAARRAGTLTMVGTALVVLTLIPNLHTVLIADSSVPLPPGWDTTNLFTWDYLLQEGLKPMADFWYPYGGFWLLQDFPTGPAMRFAWEAFLLVVAAWSLWRLVGPRPGRITLCLVAVVAVGLFDSQSILYPPVFWRYIPSFVLPVAYAAVGPLRHRSLTFGHLVLGAVCAATATMEADVFVAGLSGATFVALGDLVGDPGLRSWRQAIRGLAVDLVPVLAGVAFVFLFWTATGALDGNVRWFGAVRSVSAFSAVQEDRFGALLGLTAHPSLGTVFAVMPALLLIAGFALRRPGGEPGTTTSRLLFAAAGASAVILAKHLVRPQGVLVLFVPLVALLWTAILQWRSRSVSLAVAAGVFAGAFLAVLEINASVKPGRYLLDAADLPVRVVKNFGVIFNRDELHAAANRRFAPERFAGQPEKLVVADPIAPVLSGTGDARFAVLGDTPILYILLHQRPPYHITLYDASQKSEQRVMIDALRQMNPARLVWRRDFNQDFVPYSVRNPLVFAYAISHYMPEFQTGPTDVLRRRRPGERVPLKYWREQLGRAVDLGGIPSYSRGADHPRCEAGRGCVPYAVVSGRARADGTQVHVRIDGRGGPYEAVFATRKGVDRYAIRLDRLWYWPLIGARGVRLTSEAPGWTVQTVSVAAGDDLY